MLTRTASAVVLLAALSVPCSISLKAQQKPETPIQGSMQEFPVILQQSLTAGKTAIGTKIQAKLSIATLLNGVILPRNAVFSGEVVESLAKTKSEPSRVSIRMDSVQWKDKSASVRLYLTSWYFPSLAESGQNLQYGPPEPPQRTWNGAGSYPGANSPAYRPFPDNSDKSPSVPDTPSSKTSERRAVLKDVDTERGSDGGIVLVSSHTNLKLDRFTTYVLAPVITSANVDRAPAQ